MPILVARHRRYLSWLLPLSLAAYTVLLWAAMRDGDPFSWFIIVYPLAFSWEFQAMWSKDEYLLTDGVLLQLHGFQTVFQLPVPLAAVTRVERMGRRTRLDWKSGRVPRSAKLRLPAELLPPLEQAIEAARAAAPGSLPMTDGDARKAVLTAYAINGRTDRQVAAGVAGEVVLVVLALVLNQPLVLLPLSLLPALVERVNRVPRLLLAGNQLYVLPVQGGVHPLPLTRVQDMTKRRSNCILRTTDPEYPTLTVRLAGNSALVKQLERMLSGDAPAAGAPGTPTTAAASQPLRCSLCGHPAPGGATTPAPGAEVYICPACSDRTRHEATEAGHGLTSKEPKPM